MTKDLTFLALSALLCLVQALPYSHGLMLRPEVMQRGLGDRGIGEGLTGWAARARKSHLNMIEALVPFAVLVLVIHAAGRSSRLSGVGAELFFVARLLHVVAALKGVAWLRKTAWHTGVLATVLEVTALFLPS